MNRYTRREATRWWAAILLVALATGCSDDELSAAQAADRLRDSSMYPQSSVVALPRLVVTAELERNTVLKQRLDGLAKRGLIRMTSIITGNKAVTEVALTDAGAVHRATPAGAEAPDHESTVRAATKVFDRIVSVGPLRTSQGAKVRDVMVSWHYEAVTPFGEAEGIAAGESRQTAAAAVRFGDGWRFINQ